MDKIVINGISLKIYPRYAYDILVAESFNNKEIAQEWSVSLLTLIIHQALLSLNLVTSPLLTQNITIQIDGRSLFKTVD